jgi:flagellar assembly protein FliH
VKLLSAAAVVKMKSYSKVIFAEKSAELKSWAPDLFDVAKSEEQTQFSEDEILAVFRAVGGNRPAPSSEDGIAPISAEEGKAFSNWMPGELDWIPPFQINSWETWNELQSPADKKKPAEETPVETGPTPEEEAMEIIANARSRADEIILEAQKKAEEVLLQAQADIQKAISDGHQQGWDQAQKEAVSILQAAQKIVQGVHTWQEDMLAQSEPMVVNMIRDIAKTMFGEGISLDETALQINLNRVLENAKALGNLRIFLNPTDATRLDTAWKEYQSMLTGNRVMIIPSDKITPGGCFVQGEMGSIDARVETQLDAVMNVFEQPELPEKTA